MNNISKSVETRTETVTKESTDEQGNKIETTEQVKKKYLVITLTGKTADDMANSYSFNDTQKKYLAEFVATATIFFCVSLTVSFEKSRSLMSIPLPPDTPPIL